MQDKQEMLQETANKERRRYPRLNKRTSVRTGKLTYPVNDEDMQAGTSENISLGGVLVNSSEMYEEGSLVQLKITLPGWHRHHPGFIKVLEDSIGTPLTAIGEVLRCRQTEGGFTTAARFVNIDPDDFIALQGYLEKELPQRG